MWRSQPLHQGRSASDPLAAPISSLANCELVNVRTGDADGVPPRPFDLVAVFALEGDGALVVGHHCEFKAMHFALKSPADKCEPAHPDRTCPHGRLAQRLNRGLYLGPSRQWRSAHRKQERTTQSDSHRVLQPPTQLPLDARYELYQRLTSPPNR